MSYHARPNSVVQARTLPFFVILTKLIVVGTSIYMGMLAWKTDITAWLASAGIVGIAVGFAAKDSLANFFAGIFIIADAPYKLGDFIQFDDGLRGRVTHIGIRSTRILTRDDIEINIPNSIIGNAKIVNETGGPYAKERVAIPVSVAYGSDVDRVREVLLTTPLGVTYVCEHPAPIVFFQSFGASGLEFEVLCWIEDPAYQENVISDVNFRIYKALARAGIEIPYSKHDVYIKSFPELEPLAPQPPPKWVARLRSRAAELEAAEATEVEASVGDEVDEVDEVDGGEPVDLESAGDGAAGDDAAKQFSRVPSPLSSFFRRPLRRRGPKPT
jgi:small-conductance mechanosensitive channel